MTKYIVLRDEQPRSADTFDGPVTASGVDGRPSSEPKLEIEDVDLAGRADLLRDPSVRLIAPEMETRLIEPVSIRPQAERKAWGLDVIGADVDRFSGDGVVVAVLDTGIDRSHPAFAGMSITEKDFTGSGAGDRHGHGTHCAGTIFGRDVDENRIGVARGVESALIGKVLGDDGRGSSQMIFDACLWAMEQGAKVLSMSLGLDFPGQVKRQTDSGWPADLATSSALESYRANVRMFDTIMQIAQSRQAFDGGCVVVAASGNESRRDLSEDHVIGASLPAAATNVVSVGALRRVGNKLDIAPFSNAFPQVCAPGVDILSAKAGGGLVQMSGTSMACPHVAGIAAQWWQFLRERGLMHNSEAVRHKLIAHASMDGFVSAVDPSNYGYGLAMCP